MQAHGEKNGELWMAMDFVAGQELDHWLAEKPRSEGEIIDLAARLCQGLQHAHDLGIVHRDLKPANIIIVEGDRPVIADFGLARSRHYDTITKAHTTLGTPAYMAPEQGEGYPSDALADLYSLGCILYECLAGRPPFVGEAMQVLLAQLTKTPEPLCQHAKVSPEMETLVHKLLQKDKAKRYGSAEETRQALLSLK
jgi:serine/threonine-protein kinase